jgi:hypothetical protein
MGEDAAPKKERILYFGQNGGEKPEMISGSLQVSQVMYIYWSPSSMRTGVDDGLTISVQ